MHEQESRDTHKSSTVFTESGLQVRHLLEAVDESWSHLTLQQGVSPKEICYHLILTNQPVSDRHTENRKKHVSDLIIHFLK